MKLKIFAASGLLAAVLAGCGQDKAVNQEPPPSSPAPSQTASTPSEVELAEVNYLQSLCSASLQIYVSVQEQSDRPPDYSRALYLGLDGCTELTKAQYEQAVIRWTELGG